MTWEKKFVLQLFLFSSDIQINYFGLLVGTSRHCCKGAVYVSRSWVWRKPFFLLLFSHELFILSKQVLAFLGKRCSRVFKASFYVSRGTMNKRKSFSDWFSTPSSDIEPKQWGTLAETFRQVCQNCNPNLRKTSPMKFVFCHCSPMNYWYWAKNLQPFGVKVLAGFSRQRPTCPEEQWIGENSF